MEFSTVKSASSKQVTANIIETIRKEDPSFWPYGVSVGHHDGGLFLIREASSKEPVGFTGWQRRNDGLKKVAYYSIGILPEHRSKGYAKEAVSMLREKLASEIDEFRAFIVPHNEPSIGLAKALDIPIEHDVRKEAHVKEALGPLLSKLTSPAARTLGGMITGGAIGQSMYGSPEQFKQNPLAAVAGIGGNALLGAHMARVPFGSKLGFQDIMKALAVGAGANVAPQVHKFTNIMDDMTGQFSDATSDFRGQIDTVSDAIAESPVIRRVNEAFEKHPQKVVLGGMGVLAAPLAALAIHNYTEGARTRALNRLTEQLADIQIPERDKVVDFPGKDEEEPQYAKEANAGLLAKILPGLFGTAAGAAGGYGLNELIYPEHSATPNDILGQVATLAGSMYGGNMLGRSFRSGISPRVVRKLRENAAIATAGGALGGSVGVSLRNNLDKTMNTFLEEMPEMSQTMKRMTAPMSGIASLSDYWEKNKNWLGPTAVASHMVPLLVWMHSHYRKNKDTKDMTRHFLENQQRYLDAYTKKPEVDAPEKEDGEEMAKAAGLGAALKYLAPRVGVGAGNTYLWDKYIYGDRDFKDWDAGRTIGAIIAALTGAGAGGSMVKGIGAQRSAKGLQGEALEQALKARDRAFGAASLKMLATPAERYIMTGAASNEAQKALAEAQKAQLGKPPITPELPTTVGSLIKEHPGKAGLLAALAAGGLGYLGHRAVKALEKPEEIQINQAPNPGHLKITLPTKDPNDNETQVVLPLDAASTVNLSKTLQQSIGRDARRKLRSGSRERVRRRKPRPEEEEDEDDKVIHFDKAAAPTIEVVAELLEQLPA